MAEFVIMCEGCHNPMPFTETTEVNQSLPVEKGFLEGDWESGFMCNNCGKFYHATYDSAALRKEREAFFQDMEKFPSAVLEYMALYQKEFDRIEKLKEGVEEDVSKKNS